MFRYYVYVLCYPDGTPFYIGKGKGKRIDHHGQDVEKGVKCNLHKTDVIKQIQRSGQQVMKYKIAEFDCERDAYMYEWAFIHMTTYSESLTNAMGSNGRYRNIPELLPEKRVLIEATNGYYNIKEVASMLGKSEQLVNWLVREGKLTAIKIGFSTRIEQETVDALFQPTAKSDKEPTQEKNTNMPKEPLNLTPIKEAAKKLHVHPTTLRRAIAARKLKAVRLGQGYRVSDEALEQWLASLNGGEKRCSNKQPLS